MKRAIDLTAWPHVKIFPYVTANTPAELALHNNIYRSHGLHKTKVISLV
jgi:hypothetical protein